MLPLLLVYIAEYTVNQGVSPTLLFPIEEMPFQNYRDAYVSYNTVYQLGVFISRSSTPFIRIHHLYTPSLLQCLNLFLLILQSLYMWLPNIYWNWAVVFWEGLRAGRKLKSNCSFDSTPFCGRALRTEMTRALWPLERIVLREIQLTLVEPFATSRGEERARRLIIVEAHGREDVGYGEASPLSSPVYNEETVESIWAALLAFLVPIALETPDPIAFARRAASYRRNSMAKAAVEGALWDLLAKTAGASLSHLLEGSRKRVESGIAIGVHGSLDALVERVGRALDEGYRRIKIKIRPGWDLEPIRAIRQSFGAVPLMADANSAYSPLDADRIKRLDPFGLLMIEQPYDPDNFIDHARLQAGLETPICLDESLASFELTRQALELGSCRVVNVKIGRVGGLSEALKIHRLCTERGVPLWCGGLLESGIGRAHNLALASLPGFLLPPDLSASDRYYEQDVVEPPVRLSTDGWIDVPGSPGIGFAVKGGFLEKITVRSLSFPR